MRVHLRMPSGKAVPVAVMSGSSMWIHLAESLLQEAVAEVPWPLLLPPAAVVLLLLPRRRRRRRRR